MRPASRTLSCLPDTRAVQKPEHDFAKNRFRLPLK